MKNFLKFFTGQEMKNLKRALLSSVKLIMIPHNKRRLNTINTKLFILVLKTCLHSLVIRMTNCKITISGSIPDGVLYVILLNYSGC